MEWETRFEEKKRFWFQAPREKEETSWHSGTPETAVLAWLDTSLLVPEHGWDGTSGFEVLSQ